MLCYAWLTLADASNINLVAAFTMIRIGVIMGGMG
jgi:hypothetical protein